MAAKTADSASLTAAAMDSEAKSMKKILDSRPKRTVKLIDRRALETGATVPPHPVGINGYVYHVPWNVSVEVPDRVAEILEKQHLC